MASEQRYSRRLIEVDLPIREISAHARREKSIRHGHISTLHIWWARRPLAACRAVVCAALWPDPADELCPHSFRQAVEEALCTFAEKARTDRRVMELIQTHWSRWNPLEPGTWRLDDPASWLDMRHALLDFIADFCNWDASSARPFLETARRLTIAAQEALGGVPGSRPLVVDPFAGGGAIPLEALRAGADAFASDLNPVAVLLNKVVLQYVPKYGQRLADEVRRWGTWIQKEAEKELATFYPNEPNGATPIAYLWARTIRCEGPSCGVEFPLLKSSWVSRRKGSLAAVRLLPERKTRTIHLGLDRPKSAAESRPGTVAQASASCPVCGFTTMKARVRAQLKERRGGTDDAFLYCVVVPSAVGPGRDYRLPVERDRQCTKDAARRLSEMLDSVAPAQLAPIPDEPIPQERVWKNNPIRVHLYGVTRWGDLFTPRQRLAMATYTNLVRRACEEVARTSQPEFSEAVGAILALAVSRFADISNAHCRWENTKSQVRNLFTRQAISMLWDFAEPHVFADRAAGNFATTLGTMIEVLEQLGSHGGEATVQQQTATEHLLADNMAAALFTDPPYYDAVPYATLADFFYVWLRRSVPASLSPLFRDPLIAKDEECVVDEAKGKDAAFFEASMTRALAEGRRIVAPNGVGVVVFAHKSTAGWEAQLKAMLEAGWVITASWPIDTELGNRVRAQHSAALGSSIHLVCRPRENLAGSGRTELVGDWRNVLVQLPRRIHEWMPRLAREGVVGADAIFACLGPALEIFSRYARVEKASGARVELREYLEQVWAAVAREALSVIFEDAEAMGLEPDARLTAIWFWAIKAANGSETRADSDPSEEEGLESEEELDSEEDPDADAPRSNPKSPGYTIEFDTARKIAQGLGVELRSLAGPSGIVEIKGSYATLRQVVRRETALIGHQLGLFGDITLPAERRASEATARMKAATQRQGTLFGHRSAPVVDEDQPHLPGLGHIPDARGLLDRLLDAGTTTLDRLHQAMLLFGRGQAALLGSFLQATNMAHSSQFWKLAQALSALYPSGTDEKRWVEGVLGRKKALGFG